MPVIIECKDCGDKIKVTGGKYRDELTPLKSAKKRRAGHIGGKGCDPEKVNIHE